MPTATLVKRKASVCTVAAFCAGAVLFQFEGSFSENIWLAVTYGCFVASTVFGIMAARQGSKWPLFFAVPSALMIIVTVIGMVFIGDV
jgi:hypothetical protein